MSSCDAHLVTSGARGVLARGLAVVATAAALSAATLLGGCGDSGFRPMYASINSDSKLQEKLAGIEITPIGSRTGQRLRNELLFQNNGGAELTKEPVYRLTILLTESVGATLVNTTGNSASAVYNLDSKFILIDIKTKKVLLEGTSTARATFDRDRSVFSNVRASDDAANRAARVMADELKIRIAAFLSRPQT